MNRSPSLYGAAVAAILVLGAALRTIEYGAMGSLWLDELFIALNVTTRGFGELLTTPLLYNQVAPIGFLAAVKLATVMLGESEAGLRLVPYLFSLASLFLFWRVADRFLGKAAVLGAVAIFALSPSLLWLTRNVKQYSGDVAVVLLLVLLALRFREERQDVERASAAAAIGGIAILFSQPAVVVAALMILLLFVQQWRAGRPMAPLAVLAVGWGLGAVAVGITSLVLSPPETVAFMREGWTSRGFVPLQSSALVWLPERLMLLIGLFAGQFHANTPAEIAVAGGFLMLAVIGVVRLLRRDGGGLALLVAPLGAGFLASVLRVLPLSRRVSLYVAPLFIVMALGGLEGIRSWLPGRWKRLAEAGIVLLVAVPASILLFLIPSPQRREEARPVLQEMHANWQPGDVVFVVPSGAPAMEFYGAPLGLEPWVVARYKGHNPRTLFWDVDEFRGRQRVWVFYTHTVSCRLEVLRSYLDAIGTERLRIEDPYGKVGKSAAGAFLYDLSDPARLRRSSPETHPAPARIADDCTALPPADLADSPAG